MTTYAVVILDPHADVDPNEDGTPVIVEAVHDVIGHFPDSDHALSFSQWLEPRLQNKGLLFLIAKVKTVDEVLEDFHENVTKPDQN